MSIHVHIDRLILDGLPVEAEDAATVLDAVETELKRCIRESSLPPHGRDRRSRITTCADITKPTTNNSPLAIGTVIGRAVHEARIL
jgi:hypothetical protein